MTLLLMRVIQVHVGMKMHPHKYLIWVGEVVWPIRYLKVRIEA